MNGVEGPQGMDGDQCLGAAKHLGADLDDRPVCTVGRDSFEDLGKARADKSALRPAGAAVRSAIRSAGWPMWRSRVAGATAGPRVGLARRRIA